MASSTPPQKVGSTQQTPPTEKPKSISAPKAKARPRSITLISLFPDYQRQKYTEKLKSERETFIGELREAYLHRGLALYLGAGISRSVGFPSWAELIRSLTITMMTRKVIAAIEGLSQLHGEDYWDRTQSIYADVRKFADYDKPILMMARAIKDQFGVDTPRRVCEGR